jgi:hypothetical protein
MARMLAAVPLIGILAWSTSTPAWAAQWEVTIVASTSDGAENSLYFGQKPDATDGYDSRYEVRALLNGNIEAYFPHPEWDVLAEKVWRDIKAPGQLKSWVFEVNTALSGTEIMLKWDPFKLPEGYTVELTDMAQQAVIDMTAQSEHYYQIYSVSGPRQFTINTKAPEPELEPEPEFLEPPSSLDGVWGENKSVIHLSWTDNSEGESGFMLERKAPGEQWSLLARLDADTTSYSDYPLVLPADDKKNKNRVKYLYRVKAYNRLTESEFSNTKPIK